MSDEVVVDKIVEKLKNNEKFRNEFQEAVSKNSARKAYKLCKEYCEEKLTEEKFENCLPLVAKNILSDTQKGLLTEINLEKISGGVDPDGIREEYDKKIAQADGVVKSNAIMGAMQGLSYGLTIFTKLFFLKDMYDEGVKKHTYTIDEAEKKKQLAEIERLKKQLAKKK